MRNLLAAGLLLMGASCTSVSFGDPYFGADTSVTALGDDRFEIRGNDDVTNAMLFEAAEKTCGAPISMEAFTTRPDEPDQRFMTFRCLRTDPSPGDNHRLPPVMRSPHQG
jgi:hypothetical protein